MESFFAPIERDKESVQSFSSARDTKLSILITHLNETENRLYFEEGEVSFERVEREGERRGIRCIRIERFELKDLSESEMLTPNTTPYKIRTGAKDVKVGKASEKDSDIVEGLAF